MKPILSTIAILFIVFFSHSQRVNYPPAPSSVFVPYGENVLNELKSTLWSDDISDPLNWNFTNTSFPANDWTIDTDPEIVSISGPFQSASAANGFLFFKADTANGATSDAYAEYAGATIDLTGEPNIRIQFEQQYISDSNERTLEVSQDGITWLPFVISDGMSPTGAKEDGISSIDISSAAGNASDLHFRFHFSGSQEGYWAIDDIELRSIDSVDLRAVSVDWGTTGAWGVRMPYYSIIQSQFQPIEFCAVIANDGLTDVDSAVYSVQIPVSSFDQSETFSIQAGMVDTICLGSTFLPNGLLNYTIDQLIVTDTSELNLINNNFESSGFLEDWSYNAIYARDNFIQGVQGGIISPDDLGLEYSVGNVTDIFSTEYTHGMSVHIHPDAPANSEIYGLLYVFEDSINEWVFINQTFTYMTQTSDNDSDVHLYWGVTSTPFELIADRSYLVMAATYSWGDSSKVFATSGKSKPNTSFYNTWNWFNPELFYLTETPMVRLLFNPGALNEHQSNFNFNIAPNPANESTTLSFDLPSSSNVSFEIIDLSGKTVRRIESALFYEGTNELELNTSDLLNGVYFVKFTSSSDGYRVGSSTKRIIVQH